MKIIFLIGVIIFFSILGTQWLGNSREGVLRTDEPQQVRRIQDEVSHETAASGILLENRIGDPIEIAKVPVSKLTDGEHKEILYVDNDIEHRVTYEGREISYT
ncbi:MAG: hypothetical protein HY001_05370 [Candidatus Portnoybacteria bacterium]|nr:hypothetical protein [Candidatus Portnoybacteria bacterium]